MLSVKFYDEVEDHLLKFVVIVATSNGKWVFCKHKERDTLEFAGGHREQNETIIDAAKRELKEETGAIDFKIQPVCVYSVTGKTRAVEEENVETFGMLYAAEIASFGTLHNEIEKVVLTDVPAIEWTYPLIQPKLMEEARKRGFVR